MNDDSKEYFFDANILAYAYDERFEKKKEICKKLVESVFKGETTGVVSNQVLGELFKALIDKFGVSVENAETIIKSFIISDNWVKVGYDTNTVLGAVALVKKFKSKFWDAVIAETMIESGVEMIYTENEKDFKRIQGIKVINPLK